MLHDEIRRCCHIKGCAFSALLVSASDIASASHAITPLTSLPQLTPSSEGRLMHSAASHDATLCTLCRGGSAPCAVAEEPQQ